MSILDQFEETQYSTEDTLAHKCTLDKQLQAINDRYDQFMRSPLRRFKSSFSAYNLSRYMLQGKIISTQSITRFAQQLGDYTNYRNHKYTGTFISALIGHAFEAGENNFYIPTKEMSVVPQNLGSCLEGSPSQDIQIHVDGDLEESSFFSARYVNAHIEGNAPHIAAGFTEYCTFRFMGDVGLVTGYHARNSHFYSPHMAALETIKADAGVGCRYFHMDNGVSVEVLL